MRERVDDRRQRVEPEISDAVNSTISSAGSAGSRRTFRGARPSSRTPCRCPSPQAANTRASANRPTSAIASAARANGRSVASEGTIAAASAIAAKTM